MQCALWTQSPWRIEADPRWHPRPLLYYGIGVLVERIRPRRKGEQVGVIVLEVFHVRDPLADEQAVSALQVLGQVLTVAVREHIEVRPDRQLLGEVEHRLEQLGEGLVLQEVGVGQEAHHELAFFEVLCCITSSTPSDASYATKHDATDHGVVLSGKMAILCILKGADGGLKYLISRARRELYQARWAKKDEFKDKKSMKNVRYSSRLAIITSFTISTINLIAYAFSTMIE